MLDTNVAFGIALVLFLAMAVAIAMPGLHALLGRARVRTAAKVDSYEAGIAMESRVGTARERFSVKFYLVALLFIIFDVEAVFLYPWAVNFRALGLGGFVEMLIFLLVLFAGFVYIMKTGALKWD